MSKVSICPTCNKPVILVPSAAERASKYDKTASYYRGLFKEHSACFIKRRNEDARALLRKSSGVPKK